jgi:hypothetical protein
VNNIQNVAGDLLGRNYATLDLNYEIKQLNFEVLQNEANKRELMIFSRLGDNWRTQPWQEPELLG